MRFPYYIFFLLLLSTLSSCNLYKQNILFRSNGDVIADKLLEAKMGVESNYKVQANDQLRFQVFSNEGQEIKWIPALNGAIDPNNPQQGNMMMMNGGVNGNGMNNALNSFLVQVDGNVYLPMIGDVQVAGLTIRQLDSLLIREEYFGQYYKDSFVKSMCVNQRIIVIKGQEGQILPLTNENTTVIEAIAQSGGVPNNVRATNIRLIRGNLENPNVYVIDLTTVEGMRRVNLTLQPNDIVYLEPIRKTFLESLNDVSPFLGLITSVATLVTTIILLNNR